MASHKSAMGKPVDMAAIRTKNENIRAIGNMNVNARGDTIDNRNRVVEPASQRVNRVYTKTTNAAVAKTPVADVASTVVENPVRQVQPTAIKVEPVADLFEELSQAEMELDNDPAFEMPPVETKSKKK
jgi:hypothetical protein